VFKTALARRPRRLASATPDVGFGVFGFWGVVDRFKPAHPAPVVLILDAACDAKLVIVAILVPAWPGELVTAIEQETANDVPTHTEVNIDRFPASAHVT
jgi:hypothetical protein